MPDEPRSEDEIIEENDRLKQELQLLGRDGLVFDELDADEANVRLRRLLQYAEDENEARLLGKEPPPRFPDLSSPDWIPDIDDMVHRSARQLLGNDFTLWPEEFLSDEEVQQQLHVMIDKLAEKGIGVAYNETVPELIAYRELLSDLEQGIDVMPGLFLDGCDGCCEECFQLPYCNVGKDLAKEYGFEVPLPIIPARQVRSPENPNGSKPYDRAPPVPFRPSRSRNNEDERDTFDDIPF